MEGQPENPENPENEKKVTGAEDFVQGQSMERYEATVPSSIAVSTNEEPTKLKAPVDEKRLLRQLLQGKMADIHAREIPYQNDEDRELDICHLPEEKSDLDLFHGRAHVEDEALVQKILVDASKISLPKADKALAESSLNETYNSSRRNSWGSNVTPVSASWFAPSVSASQNSVDSSGNLHFQGVKCREREESVMSLSSGSAGSASSSQYSTDSFRVSSAGSCDSGRSGSPDKDLVGPNNLLKLPTSALQYISKPLLDRPEYNSVDPTHIARERQRDIKTSAAGKVFGYTTESKEYIKNDPEFIIPGPNPRRIPHDELINTFKGFSNMFLAHEISLNEEFRLERYIPPAESIEHRVQVQLKRAYWDLFNEEIRREPPVFVRALTVFSELKTSILGLLLPHNTKTKETIDEVLDVEHISRLIANDAFTHEDFNKYSRFIIDTLAQLCSPSRDSDVAALKQLDQPAEIFEGIMDVADKMKLDIANYYIQQFRPSIVRHCAQYERIKFADFLEVERRLGEDGLRRTRNWLARHTINRRDNSTVLAKAYAELLSANFSEEIPETLTLDIARYRLVSQKILRLAVVGAISLTVGAIAQTMIPELPREFRDLLKKHMNIIVTDDDMIESKKFKECIESAAEQSAVIMDELVYVERNKRLTSEEKDNIRQCVREIQSPDNKVRGLVYRRVIDYTEEILVSQYKFHVPIPVGLFAVRTEVMNLIGDFSQVVWHNRIVFGDLYAAIIENKVGRPTIFDDNESDPEFDKIMEILHEENLLNRVPSNPSSTSGTTTTTC